MKNVFICAATLVILFSHATAARGQTGITANGNKFVAPGFGNCFSPLGTYSVQAGDSLTKIEVTLVEVVNGVEVAVAAYPNPIQATTNAANNTWSSSTYTNLAAGAGGAVRTYKAKAEIFTTRPNAQNIPVAQPTLKAAVQFVY